VGEHAAAFSSPRPRFARSRVPPAFTRLFKSSSGTLRIWDGQHEARATRADRDSCFAAALMAAPVSCSAGRSAGSNGPPMAYADPSVRVGPQAASRTSGQIAHRRRWATTPIIITFADSGLRGEIDRSTLHKKPRKKFAEACRLRSLNRNGSRSYGASGRVMNGAHRSLTSGVRPPAATQSRRNSKDFLGFRSCVLRST
jgi:hypothetical protein